MSYYAHKNYVVKVKGIAQEDGVLSTITSDHVLVRKGDYILTDEHGIDFPVSERYYKENYIKVEKVKEETKLGNYDQMAQGYAAMAELNQNEDQDYIDELKDMVSGKPL